MPVAGKTAWVWVFVTLSVTYFHINWSRGAAVLDALVGDKNIKMICDGYGAYKRYKTVQCCWVHILHEAKYEAVSKDPLMRILHARLQWIYSDAKHKGQVKPQECENLTQEVLCVAESYKEEGIGFGTKLANAAPNLFTFLQHPKMGSTNNAAERAIRPAVLYRKAKGNLNNAKGMGKLAVMMGFYQAMRERGCSPHVELINILTRGTGRLAIYNPMYRAFIYKYV